MDILTGQAHLKSFYFSTAYMDKKLLRFNIFPEKKKHTRHGMGFLKLI